MRNNWKHTEPRVTQECPESTDVKFCWHQIREWNVTGTPVHPEVAMEIASWWHSESSPAITAFSHTGTIDDALLSELAKDRARAELSPVDREELDALIGYVRAVKGMLPDSQLLIEVIYNASQRSYVVKARASIESDWSYFEDTEDQIDELLALARDVMTGG